MNLQATSTRGFVSHDIQNPELLFRLRYGKKISLGGVDLSLFFLFVPQADLDQKDR